MKFSRLLRAVSLVAGVALGTTSASAATIDLGFSLDESGSIGPANFNLTRDALAQALGSIPTSGNNQYRIAVTTYASSVETVIPPTIVTAGNIGSLQSTLTSTTFSSGGTNTSGAIATTFNLFKNSATGLGATTILNITTDGSPNSQTASENAALAAWQNGLDGLSFEAVGSGLSSTTKRNNMADIASLGTTGVLGNGDVINPGDPIPNATETGFVIGVTDFGDYEDAIEAKIGQVVIDTGGGPGIVPLPAGLPLLLAGLGAFGVVRVRRKAA